MRALRILVHDVPAGVLEEHAEGKVYIFMYDPDYCGEPVSLTMPLEQRKYVYDSFPPFFDGVLPEGGQLEALLRQKKIDRSDYFSQIVEVGGDLVGAVTVEGMP